MTSSADSRYIPNSSINRSQGDGSKLEEKEVSADKDELIKENQKLKYRITHLESNLRTLLYDDKVHILWSVIIFLGKG